MEETPTAPSIPSSIPGPEPRKRRVFWKWSLIITGVLFALLIYQCASTLYTTSRASDAVVAEFHDHFNSEEFTAIMPAADKGCFATKEKQDEFVKILGTLRKKLGSANSSSRGFVQVNATPGGTFAIVTYDTTFSKGPGKETFTFRVSESRLLLCGYHIESQLLLME